MIRAMKPVSASVGGVEIVVTESARRRIRRAARAAAVISGYTAGVAAFVMLCVAVAQSALLWPVVGCGAVAGVVAWRCRG